MRHTKRNKKGQFAKSPGFVARWLELNGQGAAVLLAVGLLHAAGLYAIGTIG